MKETETAETAETAGITGTETAGRDTAEMVTTGAETEAPQAKNVNSLAEDSSRPVQDLSEKKDQETAEEMLLTDLKRARVLLTE